ncbi:hypothetical protein [Chlorobaculum sp. 24CR]|uniref:hypothetical protein n=1 Tax=Chlorobaculum sp. 24CR TaxID=2508878 RepID=UPI00142FF364|nr:hypothetical protein [Chlorobaculum sp. 24CR]
MIDDVLDVGKQVGSSEKKVWAVTVSSALAAFTAGCFRSSMKRIFVTMFDIESMASA